MRSRAVLLILVTFSSATLLYTLLTEYQASGLSGTGIGIRKEGPTWAVVEETIEYTITVYNLGDFWIRNVTVTDMFPNGTSSSWSVPDLAPQNQTGNLFTIPGILYTIDEADLPDGPGPLAHIQNYAEVRGYLDWYNLEKLVNAATDYPTLIREPVVVGGHSFDVRPSDLSTSNAIYVVLLLAMTVGLAFARKSRWQGGYQRLSEDE